MRNVGADEGLHILGAVSGVVPTLPLTWDLGGVAFRQRGEREDGGTFRNPKFLNFCVVKAR